jgi:hypothetical protein
VKAIVEYTTERNPANLYPEKIISPPRPSACCAVEMEQVGEGALGWGLALRVQAVWGLRLHRTPGLPRLGSTVSLSA